MEGSRACGGFDELVIATELFSRRVVDHLRRSLTHVFFDKRFGHPAVYNGLGARCLAAWSAEMGQLFARKFHPGAAAAATTGAKHAAAAAAAAPHHGQLKELAAKMAEATERGDYAALRALNTAQAELLANALASATTPATATSGSAAASREEGVVGLLTKNLQDGGECPATVESIKPDWSSGERERTRYTLNSIIGCHVHKACPGGMAGMLSHAEVVSAECKATGKFEGRRCNS